MVLFILFHQDFIAYKCFVRRALHREKHDKHHQRRHQPHVNYGGRLVHYEECLNEIIRKAIAYHGKPRVLNYQILSRP